MNRIFLTVCALLLSISLAKADLLLENGQIVDPETKTITEGPLLIQNGRIAEITREALKSFTGERIDLQGRWVIPGLNDAHVHAHGNSLPSASYHSLGITGAAQSMLAAGVTGFLDLFQNENEIFALRNRQREGKLPTSDNQMADIYAAGPIFTCSGGHGTEYGMFTRVINTPEQAELEIRALAYKKPDFIKIVYDNAYKALPTMDYATLKSAIETARNLGVKTVVHIGTWKDAEDAIDLGATAITHLYWKPIPAELTQKIRDRGTFVIPTLAVHTELYNLVKNPSLLDRDPLLSQLVPKTVLDVYRHPDQFFPHAQQMIELQGLGRSNYLKSVGTLAQFGAEVVAGTDAGNSGTFQGYSLHRELELMVEGGASTWDALASATTRFGKLIGQPIGVRVGDLANLIVLDASPVEDIRSSQRISKIIYRGNVVDREALLRKIQKP